MKLTKSRLKEIIKEEIRNLREAKQTQFQIPYREQKNVMKILRMAKSAKVGKYKEGKHYDFGVGKGATFGTFIASDSPKGGTGEDKDTFPIKDNPERGLPMGNLFDKLG